MIRFALKGILGRKLRTALTAIAVVLGVAMVSGTYVLTDSIDKAFNAIFTEVYRGTDATITPKSAFDIEDGSGSTEAPFDESLLARVKGLPGVANAIGGVSSENAQLIKGDKAIVFGGAPNLGFSVDPSKPEFNSLTLKEGAWPKGDQVMIDVPRPTRSTEGRGRRSASRSKGLSTTLRISGFVKFGRCPRSAVPRSPASTCRRHRSCSTRTASSTRSAVEAKPGVTPQELVGQIARGPRPLNEVPDRSGPGDRRRPRTRTVHLASSGTFLLAFGGIALFVGAFVIVNSLSITIAQRTRELATLRTLGASRRQVRLSVGLRVAGARHAGASLVGLGRSGLRLRKGLFSLFEAVGIAPAARGLAARAPGRRDRARLLWAFSSPSIASMLPGPTGDACAADRGR